MPIVTYGINHKTAPVDVREKLAFDPTKACTFLQELAQQAAVNEAVILSTCNRTEVYTTDANREIITQWLHEVHAQAGLDVTPFFYSYHGVDAVRHLMRVASGLDSMILGEPEIFGQIKQAYELACKAGTVGKCLRHVFPAVFSASKQIRSQTEIGKSPVTLAYATMQLARRIFSKIDRCRVLLIGAGNTIELIATHLHGNGVRNMIIANRTVEKAHELADQFNGKAIRIGDIPECIQDCDIIITATASQLPILGKGLIERATRSSKRHPMFMADLAVPRDIEPEVAELEDVYLYNIDDLQDVVAQNRKNRQEAAKQAEELVEIQSLDYIRQLHVLNAGDMIRSYRDKLEGLNQQELAQALEQIKNGQCPESVLNNYSRNLINKIMHGPTIKLREAAYHEQFDTLLTAKELFDI